MKNKGEQKNMATEAEKWETIPNPYQPYDLDSGDRFYLKDVAAEIKKVFADPHQNPFVLLIGNPGSGKSSTVQKIVGSPGLINQQYIPINLDCKKFIKKDRKYLLFELYKEMAPSLEKFDITLPRTDDIPESSDIRNLIELIILNLDSSTPKNSVFLFILDEFDYLLKKENQEIIVDFVQSFWKIEIPWDNFALLVVSDKQAVRLNRNAEIEELFSLAVEIDVDNVLKNHGLREFIIKPISDKVIFREDAVDKIMELSGNNLYFQELICSYIIEHLNREQKNICSSEDVASVVPLILNDSQKDFDYAWENKLSDNERLLVSALADDMVIEKKARYYCLDLSDRSILIFLFEGRILDHLKTLETYGYLNRFEGNRFEAEKVPFKYPLYGEWIKRNYPFLKTLFIQMERIAAKVPIDLIIKQIEISDDKRLLRNQKQKIVNIARQWDQLEKSIISERDSNFRQDTLTFFQSLTRLLNLSANGISLEHHFLDLKQLNIGIIEQGKCILQDSPELSEEELFRLENIATAQAVDTLTDLILFFHFKSSDKVESLARKRYLNLLGINGNDIKRLIFSFQPDNRFREMILEKLSLEKISPYNTAGVARATFFGRKQIIDKITQDKNSSYSIVGARRIGKTSLLHKITEEPPTDTAYIMIDLQNCFHDGKSYKFFFKKLETIINETFDETFKISGGIFGPRFSTFKEAVKQLKLHKERIVFIFDEIDDLLRVDQKHRFRLMKLFRTMSQEEICQFVFAGFDELYRMKRNLENPLYNFCNEIILNPLEKEAAFDLMTKPMNSIGIRYEKETDRDTLLEYTAGHPSLIQFFCVSLVSLIQKHKNGKDPRTIYLGDIEDLSKEKYIRYLFDDVYLFFHELSDLQKLILLLLCNDQTGGKSRPEKFSAVYVMELLKRNGISTTLNEVHGILKNLEMRFILQSSGVDLFSFALSHFPGILKENVDENYKNSIIKEIKVHGRKSV